MRLWLLRAQLYAHQEKRASISDCRLLAPSAGSRRRIFPGSPASGKAEEQGVALSAVLPARRRYAVAEAVKHLSRRRTARRRYAAAAPKSTA